MMCNVKADSYFLKAFSEYVRNFANEVEYGVGSEEDLMKRFAEFDADHEATATYKLPEQTGDLRIYIEYFFKVFEGI